MMVAFNVAAHWDRRYRLGRGSGDGSTGRNAQVKADHVNRWLQDSASVVDWGVGDGVVAGLLDLNGRDYLGVDAAPAAVDMCRRRHPQLHFVTWPSHAADAVRAEVALSLDVTHHLPDDDAYHGYLQRVCASASRLVVFHATDFPDPPGTAPHVRHRPVSRDMDRLHPGWALVEAAPGVNAGTFLVYQRKALL